MNRVASAAAIVPAKLAKKRSAPAVAVVTANKTQLHGLGYTEVHGDYFTQIISRSNTEIIINPRCLSVFLLRSQCNLCVLSATSFSFLNTLRKTSLPAVTI